MEERGIEPVEAGGRIEPGKNVFCMKICSKIIAAQFCIVIVNNDKPRGKEIPNANVNMEYGLILGHNKYVIPFQREEQTLPFNVAGLDTVKYNHSNFQKLAIYAVEQAIKETSQSQAAPTFDQMITLFLLIKNATIVNLQNDATERGLFQLGNNFGFIFW